MSGIAGIVKFDGAPMERGAVEKLTATIAFRGPDGVSHWVRGSAGLGHSMLRTTRESLEELQPVSNEEQNVTLVMDGRADNWEELRKKLLASGARLRDRSDAELVLHAYEIWGDDCLAHIDGDFALAIWDDKQRTVFCARDRIGVKPFHYYWDGKTFIFASDIHAILAIASIPRVVNEGMIAEVMADEWHTRDETLWRGVMRLPAAHCMRVGASGPRPRSYWVPDPWATVPCRTDEDYFAYYRHLLTESVRRLSRSHRSVAFEVSGGLDSSGLFCVADSLEREKRLLAPSAKGYTVDFSRDPAADELSYVRMVGSHLGRDIAEISPSLPDLAWFSEKAATFLDVPGAPNGVALTDLHKAAVADGARVVISGVGGDHFLQGSQAYYAEELEAGNWRALLRCLEADAGAAGGLRAAWWLLCDGIAPLLPQSAKAAIRSIVGVKTCRAGERASWLSARLREMLEERRSRAQGLSHRDIRFRSQIYILQALYYPPDDWGRVQSGRLDACAGIETRAPFLTHELVQFALSTPERLRRRGGRDKFIHIEGLRGILPPALQKRTTKADFGEVFRRLLLPNLGIFSHEIRDAWPEWLNAKGLEELAAAFSDHPSDGPESWALWGILCIHWVMLDFDSYENTTISE